MKFVLLKLVNTVISLVLSAALFVIIAFTIAAACVAVTHFIDVIRRFMS